MVVQGLTSVNAYPPLINFFYMITPAFRSHNFQAETRKITRWMMYLKHFLKSSRGNRKRSPESRTVEYIRKTIIYDLIHRKVCKVQTNGPEFNVKKVTFGCFCRKVCWGHSYRKVSQSREGLRFIYSRKPQWTWEFSPEHKYQDYKSRDYFLSA